MAALASTYYLRLTKERKKRLNQVVEANSMGLFGVLPVEMQYRVLQEMNLESLAALGICSRQLMLLVEKFSVSTIGWKAIMGWLAPPSDYRRLGILLRLTGAFYSSEKKLKTAKIVLEKVSCFNLSTLQHLRHIYHVV